MPEGLDQCRRRLLNTVKRRSEKHLRDIRSMLAVSSDELDREALLVWIRRRALDAEWAEAERGVE